MMRADLPGYLFCVVAALGYSSVSILARKGLLTYSSPLAGAVVSHLAGTALMALLSFRTIELHGVGGKKGLIFFILSGLGAGLAQLTLYVALANAPAVLVSPVSSTTPLMTILLVHVFLRGLERVSRRVAAAAALVVAGVILISLGGS